MSQENVGVFPDFDSVYRGHEGLTRFWEEIHEPWHGLRADIEAIDEREDDGLVLDIRFNGRGLPVLNWPSGKP